MIIESYDQLATLIDRDLVVKATHHYWGDTSDFLHNIYIDGNPVHKEDNWELYYFLSFADDEDELKRFRWITTKERMNYVEEILELKDKS